MIAATVAIVVTIVRAPGPADGEVAAAGGAASGQPAAAADNGVSAPASPVAADPPSTTPSAAGAAAETPDAETPDAQRGPASAAAAVPGGESAETSPAASGTSSSDTGAPANNAGTVGELPGGSPYAVEGAGTYRVVPVPRVDPGADGPRADGAAAGGAPASGQDGVGSGAPAPTIVRYTVEIEDGVTVDNGDEQFADFVDATLADGRSWGPVKGVVLRRVDGSGPRPAFRITLTSSMTVRGLCGYTVKLESSCYSGAVGRVAINDARWVRGSLSYAGDLTAYRRYAVNHEVGHALGFGHLACTSQGGPAPVMMQQTWSTSNDELYSLNQSVRGNGLTCAANPWPDPTATPAAPVNAPG